MVNFKEEIAALKAKGLQRKMRFIASANDRYITLDGKKVLMFTSNNYLGLAADPEVIKVTMEKAREYGIGPGTSRLLSGNVRLYDELEAEFANLVGKEAAIFFSTGYMTNEGMFTVLMDPFTSEFPLPYAKNSGVIISDKDNHASIISGVRLSSAERKIFKHNDMVDLEKILRSLPAKKRKLIVTEGSFSLEGVLCPLPEIVDLAKKYDAITLIDDAHGIGILGKRGGGTAEHFGLQKDVDIIMGSCSKALGGMGGFVAGEKRLIDYFRIAMRAYMYSSPVSVCVAAGLKKAVEITKTAADRRKKLLDNYDYLYKKLTALGFTIWGDQTVPSLPLILGNEAIAVKLNKALFKEGIYVESFRWPAVPLGTARIRIVPMSTHKKEHLDKLVKGLGKIGKEMKLIK